MFIVHKLRSHSKFQRIAFFTTWDENGQRYTSVDIIRCSRWFFPHQTFSAGDECERNFFFSFHFQLFYPFDKLLMISQVLLKQIISLQWNSVITNSVNEYSDLTDTFLMWNGHFSTQINLILTNPGYNEQNGLLRVVIWLFSFLEELLSNLSIWPTSEYDHLSTKTPISSPLYHIYVMCNDALNNEHLSRSAKALGSRWWLFYLSLNVFLIFSNHL